MSALCLKHIFQASFDSGKLPTQWKLAYVTPVHKSRDKMTTNKYRPISLTSIPQGSVLGPTLFLIYINVLPLRVNCSGSLYADDKLLYQPVYTIEDDVRFQNNFDAVHKWSVDWKMPFNDKKCKVIEFGSQNYKPAYKLGPTVMD